MTAAVCEEAPPRLMGSTTPRVATPPLVSGRPGPCGCGCALTAETSLGFEAVRFAVEILGIEPLPWQRHFLIHALELRPDQPLPLRPDGRQDFRFRYRVVLLLVARQNGKSFVMKLLALWAMFCDRAQLVLGVAQSLDIAKEAWSGAVAIAEQNLDLAAEIPRNGVRQANGEQCLTLVSGARYRIAAATRSSGRGLSVDILGLDELREQRDWAAWGALSKTLTARPNPLIVGMSNAGDDTSVVLNSLRASALAGADESIGLQEWSAPDGCDLDDPDAWAAANPGLGHTVSEEAIRSAMATDPPAVFRTETLCQRVEALDAAVDGASWAMCADPSGSLAGIRSRVAACVDVAEDGGHVTLCAAAVLDDGKVRVEVLEAWASTAAARRDLPRLLAKVAPAVVAWFPTGPAAELGTELRALDGAASAPPPPTTADGRELQDCATPDCVFMVPVGVLHCCSECADAADHRFEIHAHGLGCAQRPRPEAPRVRAGALSLIEFKGAQVSEVCMEFAGLVEALRVLQPSDQLLDAHVAGTAKLRTGDGWRFARRGAGNVDGAYAAAGAVRAARTLPAPVRRPRSRVF